MSLSSRHSRNTRSTTPRLTARWPTSSSPAKLQDRLPAHRRHRLPSVTATIVRISTSYDMISMAVLPGWRFLMRRLDGDDLQTPAISPTNVQARSRSPPRGRTSSPLLTLIYQNTIVRLLSDVLYQEIRRLPGGCSTCADADTTTRQTMSLGFQKTVDNRRGSFDTENPVPEL